MKVILTILILKKETKCLDMLWNTLQTFPFTSYRGVNLIRKQHKRIQIVFIFMLVNDKFKWALCKIRVAHQNLGDVGPPKAVL